MSEILEKISGLMNNGIFVACLVIVICIIICVIRSFFKRDQFFYDPIDISPDLNTINKIKNNVYNEATEVYLHQKNWVDWPEKDLYANNGSWEIYPFYAFGIWVNQNCNKCPTIYNYLKSIKGLKLATLSKMTPGMKLKPHRGWGKHSNNVIRCHYGLIVPKGCYISVSDNNDIPPLFRQSKRNKFSNYPNNIKYKDDDGSTEEIRFHKQFEWLVFDDSKTHYAENMSNKYRIVLIVDIERPSNIKSGTSEVGDSKELMNIINYYKRNNIEYNKKNTPFEIESNEIINPYNIDKNAINNILYGI